MMWEDTDVIIMDNQRYLINKSLLIHFDGYKNIYPEIEKAEVSFEYGAGSSDYNMNYTPYWLIKNDSIFLVGISLNSDAGIVKDGIIEYDIRLPSERFCRMEELVKNKFDKREKLSVDIKCMPSKYSSGKIFASWVIGIFYIKQIMEFDYDIYKWKKEPILKLTIKDGKVIKTEKV